MRTLVEQAKDVQRENDNVSTDILTLLVNLAQRCEWLEGELQRARNHKCACERVYG